MYSEAFSPSLVGIFCVIRVQKGGGSEPKPGEQDNKRKEKKTSQERNERDTAVHVPLKVKDVSWEKTT